MAVPTPSYPSDGGITGEYIRLLTLDIAGRGGDRYASCVKKTTIVVDDALLERAQDILGTRGLKATVDRALLEVIELDARRRAIAQLQAMEGLDLDREEIMAKAWH